jgi:hypothetical protein
MQAELFAQGPRERTLGIRHCMVKDFLALPKLEQLGELSTLLQG